MREAKRAETGLNTLKKVGPDAKEVGLSGKKVSLNRNRQRADPLPERVSRRKNGQKRRDRDRRSVRCELHGPFGT